ncbi:MAG: beta strand repeat-containing protein, partial [Litorivicinus sp.]
GHHGSDSTHVHHTTLGSGDPTSVLNQSLVIDLGARSGLLNGHLYLTQDVDGVAVTTRHAYSGIADVNGTEVSDLIQGHAGANRLDGGDGDDIIYGGGGADTLIGGAGTDYVLFSNSLNPGALSPYPDGVTLNLAAQTYSSGSVSGAAESFENAVGSEFADTIEGSAGANILVSGGGDDSVSGLAGSDTLIAGGVTQEGAQLAGGADADQFWVGYDLDPAARTQSLQATATAQNADLYALDESPAGLSTSRATGVVLDWDGASDSLYVSSQGTAVVAGLTGGSTNWDVNNTVDLTNATNAGVIKLAAGQATNTLTLASAGAHHIFTGYEYSAVSGVVDGSAGPALSGGTATDLIYGWDGRTAGVDRLTVAAGSQAVVAGLRGGSDFSGDDLLDLRNTTTNSGTIIASLGAGDNTFYGSAGVDQHFGSSTAGHVNQVWGGAGVDEFNVGVNRTPAGVETDVASTDILRDFTQGETLNVSSLGRAVISSTDWTAANTLDLSGAEVTNSGEIVVALGELDDRFVGSSGNDIVFGETAATGNQIWGGNGADHFMVGILYDEVAANGDLNAARSVLGAGQVGVDVIRDWQNGSDTITVGAGGEAVVAGVYGVTGNAVTGNDTVDLSGSTNAGTIVTALGAGDNSVTGSAGADRYWVGYQYVADGSDHINGSAAPAAEVSANDIINAWDDQSSSRDTLNISANSTATIASLQGQTNWDGNDTVDLRAQVANSGLIRLAAGQATNSLYLSAGSDHVFTGYNPARTPVTSGAAIDFIYGWDAQAWSHVPFDGSYSSATYFNGAVNSSDGTYDRLTVAAGSVARIAALEGMDVDAVSRWSGVDTVDLRSNVTNSGVIEVATGDGTDTVFGSSGVDHVYAGSGQDNLFGGLGDDVFFVGYTPSWAVSATAASEHRVWDWQNGSSAGAPGDGLRVAADSFVVMSGLHGMDPTSEARWNGNDTLDLRWNVVNYGLTISELGAGDDTFYGSSGNDYLNPGSGSNTLDLSLGGADRVYLDAYNQQTQISGFDADDKLFLDSRVLESFSTVRGINELGTYDVSSTVDLRVGAIVGDGQAFDKGSFITSKLTYLNTYKGVLGTYNETPRDPDDFNAADVHSGSGPYPYGWASNGAWNNSALDYAHDGPTSKAAVIAAGTASILIGNGLAPIPFVGIALAIPFWVNGGLMLNDGINNVQPQLNATYNDATGQGFSGGAVMLAKDAGESVGSSVGVFDTPSFTQFYNTPTSEFFVETLEISGHQSGDTLNGVSSYVLVGNGTETFVYLVFSKDGLIQNNETRLIAQVNGTLNADQVVMYDGASDETYLRYFNNSVVQPDFPPAVSFGENLVASQTAGKQVLYRVTYTEGSESVTDYVTASELADLRTENKPDLQTGGAFTNDTTVTLTANFDAALRASDQVRFYLNGSQLGSTLTGLTTTTAVLAAVNLGSSDGTLNLRVEVESADGLTSEARGQVTLDTAAPRFNTSATDDTEVTIASTADKLIVTSTEAGTVTFGSTTKAALESAGNQVEFDLVAQSSADVVALSAADVFGHSVSLGTLWLGTAVSDSVSTTNSRIYGFGGDDTLTALSQGAYLYGQAGSDTLISSAGAIFNGGLGADTIDLRSSSDVSTIAWQVSSTENDSSAGAMDAVYGYESQDVLSVVATGIANFSATSVLATTRTGENDTYTGVTNGTATFTTLGFDFNGDGDSTDASELQVDFLG